jgi:putative sterol carrier protein
MPTYTDVNMIFENICTVFNADKATNDNAMIQFDLSGDNGGKFWVKVSNGTCESGKGAAPSTPDMTLLTAADDWLAVTNGTMNAMNGFMQGKIKVQGNMGLAMKLQSWFKMS